jgi:hypothetical protein
MHDRYAKSWYETLTFTQKSTTYNPDGQKRVFSEEYSDIQCNAKLDPGTFDPKQFSATHWEKP